MSTNYYLKTDVCECCQREAKKLHIGKNSYGWEFMFHGVYAEDEIPRLDSWKVWREFIRTQLKHNRAQLVDEYDDPIAYNKFVKLVHDSRKPYRPFNNGGNRQPLTYPLNHYDWVAERGWCNDNDKKDEQGWSFHFGEFS